MRLMQRVKHLIERVKRQKQRVMHLMRPLRPKKAEKPPTEELQREWLEKLQREREHLENLFADRINFYMVFAAGVLVFLLDKEHAPNILKFALIAVIAVSVLMLIALLRTLWLVMIALGEIVEEYSEEPYSKYHNFLWFLPNANLLLLFLPIVMTIFFSYALYQVTHSPAHKPVLEHSLVPRF